MSSWVRAHLCKLQKGYTRLAAQVIKFTSCFPRVGGSLRVLRLPPPLKLVAIAEILLKVELNTKILKNSISYVVVSLCVQWVKVRSDCLFCSYWWHCWQLLFKLSFHNNRLRNQCRSLKYDLYRKHIIDCKSSMGVTSLLKMLDIISHIWVWHLYWKCWTS
jgi:hypothetical protein